MKGVASPPHQACSCEDRVCIYPTRLPPHQACSCEDSVYLPYETLFIGDRQGQSQRGEGGRVREGPGTVIVHYMQLIYIYKYIYNT